MSIRDPRKARPVVESLETKQLLTAGATAATASTTVAVIKGIIPSAPVIELGGTIDGGFQRHQANPDTGATFNLFGIGSLKHLGLTTINGSIGIPGFIANGHATGTLHLSTLKGSLTLHVTAPALPSGTVPPNTFQFTVTSGTGSYRRDLDQGTVTLHLGKFNSGKTEYGKFAMTFVSDQMAVPLLA